MPGANGAGLPMPCMALEQEQQRSEQEQAEQEEQLEQLDKPLPIWTIPTSSSGWNRIRTASCMAFGCWGWLCCLGVCATVLDQAPSLQDHFAASIQELQAMAQLDGSLEPLAGSGAGSRSGCEALLRSLDQYGLALESDPEHLERIQDRLSVLKRLQRRFMALIWPA